MTLLSALLLIVAAPEVPELPELPEVPLDPDVPEDPDDPLVPDEPDDPLVPELPLVPDDPLDPEVPLEPEFNTLANKALALIGTGDPEILKQKLAEEKQRIRNQAAKLNPGMADILARGEDLKDYADQYMKIASAITRKTYDMNNPLIKKMMNYKDEKGNYRAASDIEAYEIMRGSSDWDSSPDAFNSFSGIGDIIERKLG